jgi:potassium voltage-gated channel Shaker-related subfamily A protein 1
MDFCRNGMNFVDTLAIMPYFVTIGMDVIMATTYTEDARPQVATFLRLVRIFRALRILKLSRYSRGLRILGMTLYRSARVMQRVL